MHLKIGLIFIAIFLATGLYMVWMFSEGEHERGLRMMYRTAHTYILLSALVNLALGTYVSFRTEKSLHRQQMVGSWMLLFAPAIFTLAFFAEPTEENLMRPISLVGMFAVFLGVLFHWNAFTQKKKGSSKDSAQPT